LYTKPIGQGYANAFLMTGGSLLAVQTDYDEKGDTNNSFLLHSYPISKRTPIMLLYDRGFFDRLYIHSFVVYIKIKNELLS